MPANKNGPGAGATATEAKNAHNPSGRRNSMSIVPNTPEQSHTFECDRCDYNVMSADATAIVDAAFSHGDYHVYADEFATKSAIPVEDLEHYPDLADEIVREALAKAEILDDKIHDGPGGVRATLDYFTEYDSDGIEEGSYYSVLFDKGSSTTGSAEIHPSQIPDLITELERLHEAWKTRTDLRTILRNESAIRSAAEYREDL